MYKILEWVFLKFIEPILSLLEQLGIKETIKKQAKSAWLWVVGAMTTFASLAYGAWLWFYSLVPLWAVPLVVVTMIGVILAVTIWIIKLSLGLIEQFLATRSRLSFDKENYREFGQKILELHQDIARAHVDWTRETPIRERSNGGPSMDWEKERHHDRIIVAQFAERFAPRHHSIGHTDTRARICLWPT